ncbi:MAG TPA: ThiF family adenylyltransferase [Planctomycetota bacterium]|nr:ThiF family adenylyltransferase [Planctomycetota bacterium]
MMQTTEFNYERAFARNRGLLSAEEQHTLRRSCVALAGLGGVGGAHLQALTRMGIGAFRLADPDTFEVVNFNRQSGARLDSLGRNKAEVMAETARSINPEACVQTFTEGISRANLNAFLAGADVVIDGLEFFCIETRRMLFADCRERRIPIITAGPIGYGASVLVFTAEGQPFETFFRIEPEMTRAEQILAFALGLAPGLGGDVDPRYVDVEEQKGPALASSCLLCAAAAATEVLKLLCKRGRISAAPKGVHYDLFRGRSVTLRPRPSLTRSLRGRLLRWIAFRRFPAFAAQHAREFASREGAVTTALSATGNVAH